MNYQDFESAWYLGLIITGGFAILLYGSGLVARRLRPLWRQGDRVAVALVGGVTAMSVVFVLAILLAALVVLVIQGGA